MSLPPFKLPQRPCRHRFSDPCRDFELEEEKLARIAALAPAALSYMDLLTIFNGYLPAGTFEEMAPYVPTALDFIRREADDNQRDAMMILENLIIWCYVELPALTKDTTLQRGIQEALMTFFRHWTSQTACCPCTRCASCERPCTHSVSSELRHDLLVETLLFEGDVCADISKRHRSPIPWLASTHYLPILTACDTVPHAAWALHVCVGSLSTGMKRPKHLMPVDTIHKAVDMVENWLLSPEASPEDIALWDELLSSVRMKLTYAPERL